MTDNHSEADAVSAKQLHHILTGNDFVKHDTIIELSEIHSFNDLDDLFGDRFYKIVFIRGENQIGHWVLLSHVSRILVEYFDSTGNPPPDELGEWMDSRGVILEFSKVPLQHPDSFNCGRFVLARISSQPTPLQLFLDILRSSRKFTPDEMVRSLFNVDEEM